MQKHLVNVYAALAATVLACALGATADLWVHWGGLATMLAGERWANNFGPFFLSSGRDVFCFAVGVD